MKRHVQKTGVRQWAGDDLVELQAEPLKALDAYFGEYGPCVIKGCEVTASGNSYNVAPGLVALGGTDQDGEATFKVAPFAGVEGVTLPVYLTLSCSVVERAYIDRKVKPIAYDYRAVAVAVKPAAGIPFVEINTTGSLRFVDVVGLSRKLDKTGDGKEVTVAFSQATDRTNVASGEKLSALWGKVSRFFADLKTVAFTGKAADLTEDTTHRLFTDAERTKLNGVEANANNYTHPATHSVDMLTESAAKVVMTKPERDKLAGIEAGANAYAHPATHPAGMIAEDASRRFSTDVEKQNWNSKAAGDHNHNTVYSGINHNHTGIYQPAGNYAPATHGHAATEVAEDASHRYTTDAEKQGWNSKAAGNHNHDAAYSQKNHNHTGVYAPATHDHTRAQITDFPTSLPASDVSTWAKQPTKPVYTAAEVGAAVVGHGHAPAEVGAVPVNASCNKNWEYNGQSGQPGWLWGSNDGSNMYVWSPSEFSVKYAVTAGSAPASDVPAWAKQSAKPAYTAAEVGAAVVSHNHTGVYQPVGNYSITGHGHNASDVTEQTNKRFMTDTERSKVGFLANMTDKQDFLNVICAGRVSVNGQALCKYGKKRTSDGAFYVTKGGPGEYWINHNYGKGDYWVVGMTQTTPCLTLITLTFIEQNRCQLLVRSFNGTAINDDFSFIIFATNV